MSCDKVITLEIQTYKWQPSICAWLGALAYTGGCSRAVSYFHTYMLINDRSENADWIFIMRFNLLCPSLQSHWASQLWVHSVARSIFSLRDISHPARSFIFPTPPQPPGSAHGTNAATLVNLFPSAMGYEYTDLILCAEKPWIRGNSQVNYFMLLIFLWSFNTNWKM